MFDAKTALFCLKKLRLQHFCRKCHENLNIGVLRTKFWFKSACEDAPQVVPAWTVPFGLFGGFRIWLLSQRKDLTLQLLTAQCTMSWRFYLRNLGCSYYPKAKTWPYNCWHWKYVCISLHNVLKVLFEGFRICLSLAKQSAGSDRFPGSEVREWIMQKQAVH